jgi:energy-coupling factor transport system ATP-binding protein
VGSALTRPVAVAARRWGWRHATRAAWALRGVDLEVQPGERVLLLGPSGAGKSTLLAGLAGLLTPDSRDHQGTGQEEGRLLLDGVPARTARESAIEAGAARTGLLLQDPSAQTVLARCGDDVAFGLENHGVPREQIWPRVSEALQGIGFPYGLAHPTSRLSGGERQRLALAGVVALRPGLLLLDEPTSMLDPDGATQLRALVAGVLATTGATCIVVEHRVAAWLDLVERVVVLGAGGGVVADGAPGRVLRDEGERLAAQGVWVPARSPRPGRAAAVEGGPELLGAHGVAVRRSPGAPPAVRDVDVQLHAGRALGVVGANGSGKSSFALALAGLIPPSAGEVVATAALDPPRGPHPHRWRARELVSRIGSVFQEPQHQFVAATCAGDLAVGPRRMGLPEAEVQARVEELLGRLRLAHLAQANPFTLSGGEQRRLSVATVLACRPPVLVLDEPTFGQDARTWADLLGLLLALRANGSALVVVTHDEALVDALADDVLRLDRGAPVVPAMAELP